MIASLPLVTNFQKKETTTKGYELTRQRSEEKPPIQTCQPR